MTKEGSSDYKKVIKRCSLTEWFFYGINVKKLLNTFIFKSVGSNKSSPVEQKRLLSETLEIEICSNITAFPISFATVVLM